MNNIFPQLCRGLGIRFLVAVLITIGLIFATFLQPVLQTLQKVGRFYQGYHRELIDQALSSDTLSAFLPILAAIPLAGGYLEDVKSKFARFFLVREGYCCYLIGHCVACWLCGSISVLLGVLAAYGFTTLVLLPLECVIKNPPKLNPCIANQMVLLFLNGGMWAVLGMTMSTVMESKYIAYASPFLVYYLLVILHERYFPGAYLIYPREWLYPSDKWPFGIWGIAIFLIELTALLGLVFYHRGKRRLRQL